MPVWLIVADAAAAVLVLVLLYGVCLVVRRRWISRNYGTFELSTRVRSHKTGRGWVLGVGRYAGDTLEWFRVFSLRPGPTLRLDRSGITFEGRRQPQGAEVYSLYAGHLIVICHTPDGELEVAMAPEALTGFLAWLEAAPPGRALQGR